MTNNYFKILCIQLVLISMSTFCYAHISDTIYLKHIIQSLADDSMRGREAATIYETKAANFIIKEFNSLQLSKAKTQRFDFIHPSSQKKETAVNIYYYINNNAPNTILIGAHYDHIGLGEYKSLSYAKKGQVHNGADDNASGVALMLDLAKHCKQWDNKKYNYLFVAYSAHELGLYGSEKFSQFITKQRFKSIALVINFDMVGRLDTKERVLSVYGYESLKRSTIALHATSTSELHISTIENDKILQTDAKHFYSKDIPALSFTTGIHDDYHKISDDEKYINYNGLIIIETFLYNFLSQIH